MIAAPAGKLTEMVGAYITEKTGMRLTPGNYSAMLVVDDNSDFVAGIVFTNYRTTDVEISCAAETPHAWKPHVRRAIFTHVFNTMKCVRCTSITVKGNRKARTFLEGLGFQLEGNVRLGYDGVRDALIYGLLRSECRDLTEEESELDGQEIRPDPAPSAGPGSDGGGTGEGEHRERDGASEPEPDQPVHAARVADV